MTIPNEPVSISNDERSLEAKPGRVPDDLRCRSCGYRLIGFCADGHCPECGAAVRLSMRGTLLRFSDPAWLEQLRRGCLILSVAVIGYFLSYCIGNFVSIPLGGSATGAFLDVAIGLGVSMLALTGVWMLTTGEPSETTAARDGNARFLNARFLARTGQSAAVFSSLLSLIATSIPVPLWLIGWIPLPLLLFSGVGFLASIVYVLRLSARLPKGNLAAQIRINLWGWSILFGLALLSVALMAIATNWSGSPSPGVRGGVAGIGGLGLCSSLIGSVVFGIWSLVLLLRLHSQISEELRIAKQIWQT